MIRLTYLLACSLASVHCIGTKNIDYEMITDESSMDPVNFLNGTFPPGFIWSTATAAYQIEGAWNKDGKGPSIWDHMAHRTPNNGIYKNQTGDIACDSYDKYVTDIGLMKAMGLKYYRLSLSWARILPTGLLSDGFNQPGVDYYNNVLNLLKANNITPMVTLYHWDLPQALQSPLGGWQHPDSSDWFAQYADFAFKTFGDRVPYWITFNEPWITSVLGYGSGVFAPNVNSCKGTCPYYSTHNIIKAHAKTYRLYHKKYAQTQKGKVGITLNIDWCEPMTQSQADKDAAERDLQWQAGWFAHPIFVDGHYPPIMRNIIASKSNTNGLPQSRLPQFTAAEAKMIKGSHDFFGLNTYTSHYSFNQVNNNSNNYFADKNVGSGSNSSWPSSGSSWLKYTPWGTRKVLNWIKNTYGNPPVIITENGWSDKNGTVNDWYRVAYYKGYINNVLKAIEIDGCNVKGYTAWSLMDNLEWASGYSEKFGLHSVDFNNPNRPRTPKASAKYYSNIIANNGFGGGQIGTTFTPMKTMTTSGGSIRVNTGWICALLIIITAYFRV